jgi:hypothetical protein
MFVGAQNLGVSIWRQVLIVALTMEIRLGTDPYSWGFGDGSAPATSVVDGPLVGDSESRLAARELETDRPRPCWKWKGIPVGDRPRVPVRDRPRG